MGQCEGGGMINFLSHVINSCCSQSVLLHIHTHIHTDIHTYFHVTNPKTKAAERQATERHAYPTPMQYHKRALQAQTKLLVVVDVVVAVAVVSAVCLLK